MVLWWQYLGKNAVSQFSVLTPITLLSDFFFFLLAVYNRLPHLSRHDGQFRCF